MTEITVDEHNTISDEQIAENMATVDNDEVTSAAVQEAIAKFRFVQKVTSNRNNMRDNSRRTKILAGNEKISAIVARFKI